MRLVTLALVAGCGFHGPAVEGAHGDGGLGDGAVGVDGSPSSDGASDDGAPQATCTDGVQNGNETDLDCGGTCGPCNVGQHCGVPHDCALSTCDTGSCRLAAQCYELHTAHPDLGDGAYALGAGTTFCDMTVDNGGWTLVGKTDGQRTMYATWLVTAQNTAALTSPTITAAGYACLAAVDLAVNRSTEIRFSNSARDRWIKWPLPAGRTTTTWWHHAAGQSTINGATQSPVTITAWNSATMACFQNIYGINPFNMHGGAFPYVGKNSAGNVDLGDLCMSVGTMVGGNADGFSSNGNGFDAPSDENTWPNPNYNISPHVAVWLR